MTARHSPAVGASRTRDRGIAGSAWGTAVLAPRQSSFRSRARLAWARRTHEAGQGAPILRWWLLIRQRRAPRAGTGAQQAGQRPEISRLVDVRCRANALGPAMRAAAG